VVIGGVAVRLELLFSMRLLWPTAFLLLQTVLGAFPAKRFYDTHNYYAIEHDSNLASLDDVLRALGLELVEQAGELKNHWLVRTLKKQHNSRGENEDLVIEAFRQLQARASTLLSVRSEDADYTRRIAASVKYLSKQELRQRVKRAPPKLPDDYALSRKTASRFGIQDPLFERQWHLVNNKFPEHSMNATSVWEMGLTGKGIISSLVDDGLDYTSDDLAANFVRLITFIDVHVLLFERMRMIHMTSMTMNLSQHPKTLTITMELDAQVK